MAFGRSFAGVFRRRDPVPGLRPPLVEDATDIPTQNASQRTAAPQAPGGAPVNAGELQVMAHTLIADLFGVGLRAQSLAQRVPAEFQEELEELADQLDKAIHEVRGFVFRNPA